MYLPEDTLDTVDGLSNRRVDRVVMVDIQILKGLHFQRVDVNIQRQQVEREVSDIYKLI